MNSVQNNYNPYNLNSYRVILDEDAINSVKNPDYVINKEEKKRNKKAIVSICTITGGLTLLITGLALLRRGNGANIESIKKYIDAFVSKFEGKESLSKIEKRLLEVVKKQKGNLDKIRSVNNFASVKDVPFCKGMKKLKMGGFCDRVTKLFGKMTHNTLTNSYNKAEKAFAGAFESLMKLDAKTLASRNPNEILEIGGVKKTIAEWLKMSSECQTALQRDMQEGFSVTAHTKRFGKLKESLSTIQDEFWNKLFKGRKFKSTKEMGDSAKEIAKKLSDTFVLEDLASSRKLDYLDTIYKQKSAITNTFADKCEQAIDVVQSIRIESAEANTYREQLKKIAGNLKQLMKIKGQNSEAVMEELSAQTKEIIESLSKSSDVANKEKIIEAIKTNIENLTKETQTGKVQQLLEIQKGLLSPKEYAELEKSLNNAVSKLNKSARLEGGDFFDKIRDISSGSAVTDVVLTAGVPVLGTTAAMVTADTKQQRRSTLLKAGIPLVGGVAVSLICTAGIIPIGISMGLGLASSAVLNRIGKVVNAKFEEKDKIDELNKKTEQAA
ncbi:hypothetical protein IJI31_00325 [bacterium]|nr:hypothetical protein [bacterium]